MIRASVPNIPKTASYLRISHRTDPSGTVPADPLPLGVMSQGGSSGDWRAAGTADAAPDSDSLRRELRDPPRELVDWEAACLKNIADLLDSLDRARARWESLGDDLTEAQTRLERATEERDLLAGSHTDAQKARDELRDVRQELEAIRRERDDGAASLVAARELMDAHIATQQS